MLSGVGRRRPKAEIGGRRLLQGLGLAYDHLQVQPTCRSAGSSSSDIDKLRPPSEVPINLRLRGAFAALPEYMLQSSASTVNTVQASNPLILGWRLLLLAITRSERQFFEKMRDKRRYMRSKISSKSKLQAVPGVKGWCLQKGSTERGPLVGINILSTPDGLSCGQLATKHQPRDWTTFA